MEGTGDNAMFVPECQTDCEGSVAVGVGQVGISVNAAGRKKGFVCGLVRPAGVWCCQASATGAGSEAALACVAVLECCQAADTGAGTCGFDNPGTFHDADNGTTGTTRVIAAT